MSDRPSARASAGPAAAPSVPAGELPERWHELASGEHFWMQWRLAACRRLLDDCGLPTDRPLRGLEIGCGRGLFQRQLADATDWMIDGCDLDRGALAANDAPGESFLYDIHERRAELHRAYAFLVLFDVLEHVADTATFLESALFHLAPGGFVLVNVPALMWLYSAYDRVVGHLHRYRRDELANLLRAAGLAPVEVRYWGFGMLPLLVARRPIAALQRRPEAILAAGFEPPGAAFSAAMRALMRIETALVARPPLGTSLMAVAREPA